MSNEVLYKACVGIAEIIHTPGTINVDFEDLKTVMSERGTAIIGLATASGPDRARVAAEKAIACPLLEGANLQGARGLLAYFTGNESVTLAEIKEAMAVLNTFVHKTAIVIFGSAISEEMGDEIRVTLVATGLDRPLDADQPAPVVQPPPVFTITSGQAEGKEVSPVMPEVAVPQPATSDSKADEPKFVIPAFLK